MKKTNTEKYNSIKITHYNILKGGEDRLNKINKVIEEMNPDVCGLLETVGWDKNISKYKKIYKTMGYKFFYFAKANSKYNITILSKIKIQTSTINKGVRHVIVGVKITDKNYTPLNIYYVHLSPISEEDRLDEIEILLKKISRQENTIIMGDFNSLSLSDKYNEKRLLNKFLQNNIVKYGTTYLKFDVIPKIEKMGFIDAFRFTGNKFDHSVPTKCNVDINHKEKLRIDYAFVKNKIIKNIKICQIYKSETSDTASDHYPLNLIYENK